MRLLVVLLSPSFSVCSSEGKSRRKLPSPFLSGYYIYSEYAYDSLVCATVRECWTPRRLREHLRGVSAESTELVSSAFPWARGSFPAFRRELRWSPPPWVGEVTYYILSQEQAMWYQPLRSTRQLSEKKSHLSNRQRRAIRFRQEEEVRV